MQKSLIFIQCFGRSFSLPFAQSHSLAKDGATAQFMLGWDTVQHMPDRSTGFFGPVHLERTGSCALLDSAVQTIDMQCSVITKCTMIRLLALSRFEGCNNTMIQTDRFILGVTADWGERWEFDVSPSQSEDFQHELVVTDPSKIKLWWPHGVGVAEPAHLHSFSFLLRSVDGSKIDAKIIPAGIRTIDTYLDTVLQGQRFQINKKDVYLVGGNWITTDQALRYSASEDRYCNEIALHRHAGLNLIRVWGYGGVASLYYACCLICLHLSLAHTLVAEWPSNRNSTAAQIGWAFLSFRSSG